MKKSTPEERRQWKEKRRFRNWQKIIDRLNVKIKSSQRALDVSEKAVRELTQSDRLQYIQQSIRSAN